MQNRLRSALLPLLVGALIGAAALALRASAGDLTPPTGPVAATNRTAINPQGLTLPYTISEPGSYVLMGNIVAPGGFAGSAISIDADDVTLDLNGFAIVGDGNGTAVGVFSSHNRIAIRNGSVRNWQTGLSIQGAEHAEVSDLRVTDGAAGGLLVGRYTVVTRCVAHNTGNVGIQATDGCVVSHCTANANTGIGILAGQGSVITDCASYANTGGGVWSGFGSVIADCSAYANTGIGIRAGNSLIRGNVSVSNGGTQIEGLGTSTLIENH